MRDALDRLTEAMIAYWTDHPVGSPDPNTLVISPDVRQALAAVTGSMPGGRLLPLVADPQRARPEYLYGLDLVVDHTKTDYMVAEYRRAL